CHTEAKDIFAGSAVYATSTHATSVETVPVAAEWAKNGESMRVGECDVCHNPMGDTDSAGVIIPKLARRQEGDLCLPCHNGSKGGLDIAQFEFPVDESSRSEIAMVWDPERIPEVFTSLSAFAAETTGTVPRALFGPREWPIEAATGNAAFGNIDGIGTSELVVADIENDRLMVFRRDSMNGLARTVITLPVGVKPSFIAIDDYVDDLSLRPEIAIVSREIVSPFASVLRLLRYNSGTSAYDVVDGPYSVGDDVTGIASGDVTGTALPDLIVTSAGTQSLRIATKSILGPTEIIVSPAYATRAGPRGPSVGDAISANAGNEIVVANCGVTANTISIFNGAGQEIASYDATAAAGASAWYTLVADVIPEAQSAGAETTIAMRHPTGVSSVLVYERAAGLIGPARHDTGTKYNTASLAFGDVDYDGRNELVAGNAGYWGFDVPSVLGVAPNVQAISFGESGAGSVTSETVRAGGAELAGGQPSLVVADFGPIGHSGHPTEGATGAHVSTETAGFQQHAECVDCHNPHAEQVTTSYNPPLAPATNRGAWGVKHSVVGTSPLSFTLLKGVTYEYELCFKCHSSWTQPANSWLDIASECDTRNASFHGILSGSTNASVPLASFVATTPALTNSTVMLCTTCHANSDSAKPRGPHDSKWSPMLAAPYSGVAYTDTSLLCYRCHKYDVYVTGSEPTTYTLFYDPSLAEPQLHKLHVGRRGFTCIACHTSHGSDGAHLVRPGLAWFAYPDGGACYTECHPGGGLVNVYSRVIVDPPSSVSTPTAFSVTTGTIVSGNLASLIATDGDVLNVATDNGTPAMDFRLTFGGTATPPRFINVYGSYSGQHSLSITLYNFTTSTYDEVGVMPRNTTNLWSYPVINGTPYISGGEVRIQFLDNKKSFPVLGNLILDRVLITH
ncbi:MAG: cytochrome c3 family protein, partial [Coriobacteriia bacterium]|nr:cytochrome c3 family protein [Coriobacteriia bacterium]